jgi:hypothetical protein
MNIGTRDVVTCITCYARDSRDKELSETFQQKRPKRLFLSLIRRIISKILRILSGF